MENIKMEEIKNKACTKEWKEKNKDYLNALEKFLDTVDNVENENLKMEIIYKMLKCDEILTQIVEKKLVK